MESWAWSCSINMDSEKVKKSREGLWSEIILPAVEWRISTWFVLPVSSYFFFLIFIYLFILFIYGCVGSSLPYEGFLQLRQAGATLHCGARASHYRGLSCCGAQAPDAQAQQLWLTGLVPPRHVGSSQTRARTRVPCIGRQILNHCATREAPPATSKPERRAVPKYS